ncbi:MAG: TldD/PmbA family protein [Anaerolineae bacterium]
MHDNLRDIMTEALKGHQADYIEIRIEEGESTGIRYRGRELEDISRASGLGGNIRALVKGGWGFVSFNDLRGLRKKVAQAISQARLVAQNTPEEEKSAWAPAEPVVDIVSGSWQKDPTEISLSEKIRTLGEYNEIIWGTSPRIQTSIIRYGDGRKRVYFANSEGSYIEQERVDLSAVFVALAREGDDVQQAFLSLGSSTDYGAVEGRHEEVADAAQRAVALLSARPVKGGTYTVIVDPYLAGVFIHEAFGHLSEADHVYENPRLREIMVLGKRFGPDFLNVADAGNIPGRRGSYKYDEEGIPAQKNYLIKEGILVGRLHSRETAAKMGEKPTGNARAISYYFPPIVRMTNTYIEPGDVPFEDMLSDIKEGVYVKYSYGGETSMEMFTFSAGQAFMIRNGKLAEEVKNVNLSGNVFETLANIEAIGNDFTWSKEGGGCGKNGQMPLPVSEGSPHIRIRNVVIGGE